MVESLERLTAEEMRIREVRFGSALLRFGEIAATGFWARSRDLSRGSCGKFDSEVMALSDKSIESS